MTRPYLPRSLDDRLQAHEWRCRACGIINDDDQLTCWECSADQEGKREDDNETAAK